MTSLFLQPIPFFPRLDFQYHRYLRRQSILSPIELDALAFFVKCADHKNIIECETGTTVVKKIAIELQTTNLHNCRTIIRKLIKLNLIKREDDKKFVLSPYCCNRVQAVPIAVFDGFIDITLTQEYLTWQAADNESTKNFPSLKRRLHNAEFRSINSTENLDAQQELQRERDIEMHIALQKIDQLQNTVDSLARLMKEMMQKIDMPTEVKAEVERHLKLVKDEPANG